MVKNKKIEYSDEDEPYLLKIDMDWIPPKPYLDIYIHFMVKLLRDKFGWSNRTNNCNTWKIYMSPSRNGCHIIFKLDKPITDEERCLTQFLLGDDRKRCRMNWQSLQLGMSDWNKLYISNRYKKID